jgi:K+-transporting ATPase ATPase B chain
MFGVLYALHPGGRGPLDKLNIMFLHSPQSAILSAVIFNALIIVALIPLALRGVKYKPLGAAVIPELLTQLSRSLPSCGHF